MRLSGGRRALALKLWSGSAKSPCRGFATRILDPGSASADPGLFLSACPRQAPAGNGAGRRRVVERQSKQLYEGQSMLGRHVYRVHHEGGRWTVAKEGEARPLGEFAACEEAVAEACKLADNDQPSRVVVDDGDGVIIE